ncbi:MAG: hypothetical protein WDO24_09470 [Pseudomonadota bacterium]
MARQTHIYVGAQHTRTGKQNGVFRRVVGEAHWEKLAGGLPRMPIFRRSRCIPTIPT